ncbi:uncharacterized protein LOC106752685 [Vigna radiata var. radiata]|uniref:Uncharacterized protein LOC106752685 n=1 Tax=Vigna radiata var. radiata TaxID=3916 RepID=A0A1S3T814_VIGRR|nr:uncharacterized protein LOC106752685 [Vigna radiata var. radiata]
MRKAGRAIQRGGVRPHAAGRVYALTGAEAISSGNLIINCGLLFGVPCVMLFDSGAIHSFISEACVKKLGLSVEELDLGLVVSIPASGLVRTFSICVRCLIVVEGRRFKVNLIYLPLEGLEVILGMDWLSANRILIDCGNKELMFSDEDEYMSFSIDVLRQDIMKDASCFLVLSHMEVTQGSDSPAQENQGVNLAVVNDFLDVFPKEVPGLPPP